MLDRRTFLAVGGAAALARGSTPATTILYGERSTAVENVRPDPKNLWVRKADLPRINDFEVKPQGACRNDVCIPLTKDLTHGEYFNLTGFAKKIGQVVVSDSDTHVYSLGEIPVLSGSFVSSRIAPDFAVPDRKGRVVHLHDFKGKKVLIVTWASW